jgi:hypothetical protein
MRIITNNKLLNRNSKIGSYSRTLGFVLILGGAYFNFSLGTSSEVSYNQFMMSFASVIIGFAIVQIGIYMSNRYGRGLHSDLEKALKGLDKSYTLYHFVSPVGHLLVGPQGIWSLIPKFQSGIISFAGKRWKQRGPSTFGNLWLGYLKLFAQEGIGRLDLEVEADEEIIGNFFKKHLKKAKLPDPNIVVIFTSERAAIQDVDTAPCPTIPPKELKNLIRKGETKGKLNPAQIQKIQTLLEENVTEDMIS